MSDAAYIKSRKKLNVELIDKYLHQINKEKFQGLLHIQMMQNESWEVSESPNERNGSPYPAHQIIQIYISFGEHKIGFSRNMSDESIYIEVVMRNSLAIILGGKLKFYHDHGNEITPNREYADCKSFYEFLKFTLVCPGVDIDNRIVKDWGYFPEKLKPLFGLTAEEIQTLKILTI